MDGAENQTTELHVLPTLPPACLTSTCGEESAVGDGDFGASSSLP